MLSVVTGIPYQFFEDLEPEVINTYHRALKKRQELIDKQRGGTPNG